MCGIIGYVGYRPAQDVLLGGLRRLEYRGYDSAGVAWRNNGRIECVRAVGNLEFLSAALAEYSAHGEVVTSTRRGGIATEITPGAVATEVIPGGVATAIAPDAATLIAPDAATLIAPVRSGGTDTVTAGIGHTRWATHGGVTEQNAHPHADSEGRIQVVLNGIIENYLQLRERLADHGIECRSETDAEVVAHLIAVHYDGDLATAVRRSLACLVGHYAIVAISEDEPGTLVGVRHECPLVVGLGDHEQFIASSIAAFLPHTRRAVVLRDDELVVLGPDEVVLYDLAGQPHPPQETIVDWDEDRCEKDGFDTFMLKEIHEQSTAVAETLSRWNAEPAGTLTDKRLREVRRIIVVGCGTSYHAGLAGKLAIERWARVPVEVEVASEFRYRDPIVGEGTLVLGISQSGETADTLAALRLARDCGAYVVAVTNAPGSQATRDADAVLFTRAGLEMGVAATKTFVAQVVLLYAFALHLATVQGGLDEPAAAGLRRDLKHLPEQIDEVIAAVEADVQQLAERLADSPFFLYLGRLAGVPAALEGALKLKEISYIPTDAYAAGEMKHGPIALLCRETPVVCVAIEDRVLPKLLSNLSEVRARGAKVFAVAGEGAKELAEHAEDIVYVPRTDPLLQVVLAVIPLQLFAYYVARARGLNVDQPRNLAKTVTVE